MRKIISVIADTHGLVRTEVIDALAGSDLIVHAGDIGRPEIVDELSKIAPLVAVRGNVDKGEWAEKLSLTELIEFEGITIYVIHDLHQLDIDLPTAGIDVVISGHSHQSAERRENGIIYINPGSIGPRRFNLPISLARIMKNGNQIKVEFRYF